MVDLQPEQNEHIIRRTKEAWRFDGDEEQELQSLVLTNKHLISVYEKPTALFFNEKTVVDKKPLSLICIIDGVLQVQHIMDDNFGESLQILYDNGAEELYFFGDAPKNEYQQWEKAIKKAVIENKKTVTESGEKTDASLSVKENKQDTPIVNNQEKVHETSNMSVLCKKCGASNNVDAKFCQNCGILLEDRDTVHENKPKNIFCPKCGAENNTDAKFCQNCGILLGNRSKTKQTEKSCQNREEDQQPTYFERKQEYAGKIIKCPNCGEVLKSFTANCPSCGFELRDAKATSSVKEFALKLEKIEERRGINKHSFVAKIFGRDGNLTDTDEQKISLIRSFSVPNTKEDVLEFMILASSNIDMSVYGWGDRGILTESRKAVSEAWIAKMEQVYEKARLTFGNTPEFQNIEKIYLKKVNEVKKRKRMKWVTLIMMYVAPLGFLMLMMSVITSSSKPTLEEQIEDRQTHLEYVVDQIEDDIAKGKFTDAKNKAYTLTFDEDLDSEKHNYWEKKQRDILEQIEKASGNKIE